MNQFEGTLIIAGLFVARLALPVAITVLFGYTMNRMFDRSRI